MKIEKISAGNIEIVQSLEKTLNTNLPEDYKNFLAENDGARVTDGYFYIEALNEKALMGIFYGISAEKGINIIRINNEFSEDIPADSILIGHDAGGGLLLLINNGKDNGVYFYDHTYFFDSSDDNKNTYFITATFGDFIDMLDKTSPD